MQIVEQWADLAPAINQLPERERRVLYLRFVRDMTQSEIADEIGVSQMHVSRLLARTLENLRQGLAARETEVADHEAGAVPLRGQGEQQTQRRGHPR